MRRSLLYIFLLSSLAGCGSGSSSPVSIPVDLPPDDNSPAIVNPDPTPASPAAPEDSVHVFTAPLVLVRGAIPQETSPMTIAPGS